MDILAPCYRGAGCAAQPGGRLRPALLPSGWLADAAGKCFSVFPDVPFVGVALVTRCGEAVTDQEDDGRQIIALAHESGLAYSISVLLNSFRGKGLADRLKAQYNKGR